MQPSAIYHIISWPGHLIFLDMDFWMIASPTKSIISIHILLPLHTHTHKHTHILLPLHTQTRSNTHTRIRPQQATAWSEGWCYRQGIDKLLSVSNIPLLICKTNIILSAIGFVHTLTSSQPTSGSWWSSIRTCTMAKIYKETGASPVRLTSEIKGFYFV